MSGLELSLFTLNDIEAALGRRLKRRRLALGLTQKQLGDRVGVTPQLIHKWETAQSSIYAARLHELAKALDAPLDYFFDVSPDATERSMADPPASTRS